MGARIKGQATKDAKKANEKKLADFLASRSISDLKVNQYGKIARDPILKKLGISTSSHVKGSVLWALFDERDSALKELERAGKPSMAQQQAADKSEGDVGPEIFRQLLAEVERVSALCRRLQYLEDTGEDLL